MTDSSATDLTLLVFLLAGAGIALLWPGTPWYMRWAFGIPFLVILPGYAVVSAMFPKGPSAEDIEGGMAPDWATRLGLSLVLSAIVVAVVGVLLATQGMLDLIRAVVFIGGLTLLAAGVALYRRRRLRPPHRADPRIGHASGRLLGANSHSTVQTLSMAVGVVVLIGAFAVVGGSPVTSDTSDPHTEVYLPNIADSGTRTLVSGTNNSLRIGLENHEGQSTAYTIVVRLQRIDSNGSVREQERLDRMQLRLTDGERRRFDRQLRPSLTGDRLRLLTLVFKGEPEGDLRNGQPDLRLRLWVSVVQGDTS